MKNMIKMSLVAAVAVAGLSSTVAAKPLEEAIKNVDVSGTVVYRYNDYGNGDDNSDTVNYYKVATSIKAKVNDTITSTVRVVAGNSLNAGTAALDTASADANPTVNVTQASFTAKVAGATIIAGKQGIATPWTKAIDSDGDEQTGTGVLALVPVGPVTFAAGLFNQTNLGEGQLKVKMSTVAAPTAYATQAAADTQNAKTGGQNIAVAAVLAKVGPVAVDAWYLDLEDTFSTYTIGAKAKIEMITIDARHTSLDLDSSNKDNSISYIKTSAKVGPVTAWINYAATDKDGGLAALQVTAKTTMIGWSVHTNKKADADMIMVGAKMDVMSGLNVSANYNTIDYGVNSEESELYTQITHSMGKNFSTYLRFGSYEKTVASVSTDDGIRARLQIEYKF